MFLVINKEKIYAYVVSVLTIVILFFVSSFLNSDIKDTQTTSTNIENNQFTNNTLSDIVSNDELEVRGEKWEVKYYILYIQSLTFHVPHLLSV